MKCAKLWESERAERVENVIDARSVLIDENYAIIARASVFLSECKRVSKKTKDAVTSISWAQSLFFKLIGFRFIRLACSTISLYSCYSSLSKLLAIVPMVLVCISPSHQAVLNHCINELCKILQLIASYSI